MSESWPWLAVAILGAYHGADPSMGWLFAVALGLQERRRIRVIGALLPIAIGHLLSVALVVGSILLAMIPPSRQVRPLGAVVLIAFGVFRLWRPRLHPRWVAMRVNSIELTVWSFLMATAHGAGLMLFPILLNLDAAQQAIHRHHDAMVLAETTHSGLSFVQIGGIILLHTAAMLIVMGIIAYAVYEWVGLKILRTAWINLDLIWAGALIIAGVLSLVI
jgi:hypothetical protein